MTYVLGINAYHGDSSACLVRDGQLMAAAEEERFRRIKHWAGFPAEAIRYCLEEAGITLDQVDHVAINREPRANLWRKIAYSLSRRPELGLILERLKNTGKVALIREQIKREIPDQRFRGSIHRVEHHMAHLASAFLVSPFDEAVVASVDGFGDFASAAWGVGRGTNIEVAGRVYFPHSLGIFYQAVAQYLGFPHYGDEYKVMGLAPYGEARFLPQMREIVRIHDDGTFRLDLKFFRHATENVAYEWEGGAPKFGPLFTPALEDLLGPTRAKNEPLEQRHRDIAHSVQVRYEEAVFSLLNVLHRRYGIDNLALAGGCAMNSVANGKVYRNTPFRRLYIQSAAGDAGGALGAAFAAWHRLHGTSRSCVMDHAYLGPAFSDADFERLLAQEAAPLAAQGCVVTRRDDEGDLCRQTAAAVAEGKVVGWFQGRMEWGPRALGNRSIICDPRRKDMKAILNAKIKRRESFRPFAPSILREAVSEWFETDDEVPFMMKVFQIREDKRPLIPAVTHVDGSGRLHTVNRGTNLRYHRLIESFRDATGIPLVLNTSFNENEPVVCNPAEALDCFLRTRMDVLVLGDFFIERDGAGEG